MSFGHGNHACPGRFFAGVEIKVVMLELLRGWDIRLVGGERPENWYNDTSIMPNPLAEVEFKRRKIALGEVNRDS